MTIKLVLKFFEAIVLRINISLSYLFTFCIFKLNQFKFSDFHTIGIPYIKSSLTSHVTLGNNLKMNNGFLGNYIGSTRCVIAVDSNASLTIGNNVGISSVIIAVHNSISIGNNVKLGAGSRIFDSDFHSINYLNRRFSKGDLEFRETSPVFIGDDVFIGANSTILKGVNIGSRSVIGAGSVVTKSVPADEIWAGNPAKFIKKITY